MRYVPIRIDVSSVDPDLRIVDTVLMDVDNDAITAAGAAAAASRQDRNELAWEIAGSVISDVQVQSMGRSAKHFTGRMDFDLIQFTEMAYQQIVEQFALLSNENANETLLPIHLRMSIHGIRIHDDFHYDPSILSPIQIAQSIVHDLNVPIDLIPPIALEIAEQSVLPRLHDTTVVNPGDEDGDGIEFDEGGPPHPRINLTAAWELSSHTNVHNTAHLVAHHRINATSTNAIKTSTTTPTATAAGTASVSSVVAAPTATRK
jgi:hypothetical protein